MEDVNELFVNYENIEIALKHGIYIPSMYKENGISNLKSMLIMHMAKNKFEIEHKYELCSKLKDQTDFFYRKKDSEKVFSIDWNSEMNHNIFEVCPKDINEAINVIYEEIFQSGKYSDINSVELIDQKNEVISARLYGNFAPMIREGFALHPKFKNENPIMLAYSQETSDVSEICYDIILKGVKKFKAIN